MMNSARSVEKRSSLPFLRRGWILGVLTLGIATAGFGSGGAAPPTRYDLADLEALERAFVELAETVRPSVVAIRTYVQPHSEHSRARSVLSPYSQGAGFVIGHDGYIVTNRHVLEDANVVFVILHDGVKYEATVIQADARSDLAVVKIDVSGLRPVRFGDLADVKVNQWAFACGNPFGLANEDGHTSITYGVVSALGRQMTNRLAGSQPIRYYGNMIETSAAINPGSSGGPLFNISGQVIGVVTAIETASGVSEGAGFAIPIDRNIRRILDTLKGGREVRYGFLGVQIEDVRSPKSPLVADSRRYRGAKLTSISFRDGPAARAGLKAKDILIEYDGTPVMNMDHLVRLVGFTQVGTEVPITYLRAGVRRTTSVILGDRIRMLLDANEREQTEPRP